MNKINLDHLNIKQREAVKEIDATVQIVAGAGSGKTMVLTYRIAYLLAENILPGHILALTFTNKASQEMKERVKKLVGEKAERLVMGTFHSIFAKFLRLEAKLLGFTSNFTIYDTDDSISLIKLILADFGINHTSITPKEVSNKISMAKNKMILPKEYEILNSKFPKEKEISAIYWEYQKRLKINNAMDFDDLLLKPIELFEKYPEVLRQYQDRFHYILVDEFQDTNVVQYKVLKQLASTRKNICVVGDDAQSIYKWRGADVSNILNFRDDFSETKLIRLEQNYRSTQSILNVANSVIAKNKNQIKKELWTKNETGDKIKLTCCMDDKTEAKYIAKKISELKQKGVRSNKISILYRLNSQSRVFEEVFIDHAIPYIIINGTEFYKRKEIKDAIAYLKLLNNSNDSVSFLRIINFPARGIGEKTLDKLKTKADTNSKSLFQAIPLLNSTDDLNDNKKKALENFYRIMNDLREKIDTLPLFEIVKELFEQTELLSFYLEEKTEESVERYENLVQFINSVQDYSNRNHEKKLEEYLQEISLISDTDKYDNRTDAINLMTLHSAKGLEFDSVFVVGLEDGLLPLRRFGEIEDIEEERRLFYVGCTRSMKNLFLTFALNRTRFGNSERQIKSTFLTELDESFVEIGEFPEKRNYLTKQNIFSGYRKQEDYSQEMPDYDNYSQEESSLRVGMKVRHDVFGLGKVMRISGTGDKAKADVIFNNNIKKVLMLKYANLKIIN